MLDFSTTLESTYWSKRDGKGVADQAYTEYNNGVERRDLYADYNPSTVAAAKVDGVLLDPTDGLSEPEKRWLYKNQSYPQQLFADIFYAGLPRERIEVLPTGVRTPTEGLRHNVHAEVYSRMQEPYWDDVHPSTAQGIVHRARPGFGVHRARRLHQGRLLPPAEEPGVRPDREPQPRELRLRVRAGQDHAAAAELRQRLAVHLDLQLAGRVVAGRRRALGEPVRRRHAPVGRRP